MPRKPADEYLPILFANCTFPEVSRAKGVQTCQRASISERPWNERNGTVGPNVRQETAKIYQFPRRVAANGAGFREVSASAADLQPQPLPAVEFGSGWYHQAAIDAERTRKPR
jgi:hypothetical protein